MITIREAAYIAASRNTTYWLRQVNRELPYGAIDAMIAAAKAEGAAVTQVGADRFLVDNNGWVTAWGTAEPVGQVSL